MPSGVMKVAVERTSSKGEVNQFSLDLDAIIAMEDEDPQFSMFTLMSSLGDKVRFKDLKTMASFIGWDYAEFCKRGYNIQDLAEIISACLEEMGFTSDLQGQST